ncbi:hypothetical protein [Deinococcus humi]|uniref:Putative SOS response-associated peptidase YedK n=1 Tax=Deinococcus humi TaxID=662880 RepID=A0A7W8K0J6_9DEIO|nr:hypothetical protein [Deinococcus humi]MBB5365373.1 putative SOS response-associated peptidase YedK [Deinococcus humi]
MAPDGLRESCTVVIRPPRPDLVERRERMPALLPSKDHDAWLHAPPPSPRRPQWLAAAHPGRAQRAQNLSGPPHLVIEAIRETTPALDGA